MTPRDIYENYEIERAAQTKHMTSTKILNKIPAWFIAGVCIGTMVLILFLFKLA